MAEAPIYAGPAIRRIRKREGLTQAAMAARLGLSPSYLNLLERNLRPLSARVIVQIVDAFDFDPRGLRDDEAIGGIDGLARRLAHERFAEFDIDRQEIADFLSTSPRVAAAFARMFDEQQAAEPAKQSPMAAVRGEIEKWRNHFADLDHRAEELADELRLSRSDIGPALAERLRERHHLTVRILPREVMPDRLRRLDLHARQVQLSESLRLESRNFHLAAQIAQLEFRDAIADIAAGPRFEDSAARALFERHLQSYCAAALVMPYGRFLRACEATGYDPDVLQRRFGASFEQVAHRLTTLQRVGQRGLPFFMVRIDRAGQFSKRFAGASNAALIDGDASCPLWDLHRAFERADEMVVQAVRLHDAAANAAHWLTAARSVEGSGTGDAARFAVAIGVEARLATDTVLARRVSLQERDAQTVGRGCEACHRPECPQRSLPPRGAVLSFDRVSRAVTPFSFENTLTRD